MLAEIFRTLSCSSLLKYSLLCIYVIKCDELNSESHLIPDIILEENAQYEQLAHMSCLPQCTLHAWWSDSSHFNQELFVKALWCYFWIQTWWYCGIELKAIFCFMILCQLWLFSLHKCDVAHRKGPLCLINGNSKLNIFC